MKKNIKQFKSLILIAIICVSCSDYLDVVPDNIATIDNAFTSRSTAEKYLFTCYSFMPSHGNIDQQAFTIGDEFWLPYPQIPNYFYNNAFEIIARGKQNSVDPSLNYWDGQNGGKAMFQGIRDCNIFLEKINNVPELSLLKPEKERWIAEVKFLKAYYHYWLLRMYGPIPLIRTNLPISATIEQVQVKREPVDDCFAYIEELLDESIAKLPVILDKQTTEMGRVTKPIAIAVKAKILLEAASPLFNGNTDYATFKSRDGEQYFNQTNDIEKWRKAADACKEAVEICDSVGFKLYNFKPAGGDKVNDELTIQMSIRNSVADNNYNVNNEVVWTNPNSTSNWLQALSTPTLDEKYTVNGGIMSILAPPLKIAEMFYTKHGVPMDEDDEWVSTGKFRDRYKIRTAAEADKYNIKEGEQTAGLHFDREVRFYANLSFDRNLWFGIGRNNLDNQWVLRNRIGEPGSKRAQSKFSATGYFCKKLANYQNNALEGEGADYVVVEYPWPVIRLADIYLMYAEALNELSGPSQEVYEYIDRVRARAGLEGVVTSWATHATPSYRSKPTTKEGLREIIQQERLIELANEGHRYWDIRRWKRAKEMWHNQPIQGWDIDQVDAEGYYRVKTIFVQKFTTKDYLWPIKESNLSVNPNLDQNPGW
ncbi:MAG: RagB/SusD family nutrient uptake outer membrane protein [Parabacteroides sp.]|nr:RagB/SusD family nutrient uptake outer membrane protein [Parabacteroides sp.]